MGEDDFLKKYFKVIFFVFVVSALLFSNFYFYRSYHREKEKLKKAIIPSVKNDYFTSLLYQVDARRESESFLEVELREYSSRVQEIDVFTKTFYSDKSEILDVKILSQNPDYPNGCEAVSATMLLNYYGFDITPKEFITRYLPMKNVFEKDGVRYGPNPSLYYAGNPEDDKRGWGCFAPVIETALKEAIQGTHYVIDNRVGTNIHYLITNLPAVIWVSIDYQEVSEIYYWFNEEETEVYTYPKNGHAVLLIGYDKDNFYINDPLKPLEVVKVSRSVLEKSYDSMGRQAITFWNGKTGLFK